MSRILRHVIPVDDNWHELHLPEPRKVICVAAREVDVVEIWAIHDDGPTFTRRLRVFGTGHQLPSHAIAHVGTAITPGGSFVWHLFADGRPTS